jgi:hypothetical protein
MKFQKESTEEMNREDMGFLLLIDCTKNRKEKELCIVRPENRRVKKDEEF